MKAIKAVWEWLGDPRVALVLAGALLVLGIANIALKDYLSASVNFALAASCIWTSYRRLIVIPAGDDHD